MEFFSLREEVRGGQLFSRRIDGWNDYEKKTSKRIEMSDDEESS